MKHILVAAHPSPGHANPMVRIAKYLSTQSYDVTLLTASLFEDRVSDTGVQFVSLRGKANHDYRERAKLFPELTRNQEYPLQNNDYLKFFSRLIDEQYASLQRIIESQRVDLIIVDLMFFGVLPLLLQPSNQRPPVITIGVTAPMLCIRESSPFAGYDASPEGLRRNDSDNRRYHEMLEPGRKHIDVALAELGLAVPGGFRWDSLYALPDLFLQLSTEEFDLPTHDLPKNFRFVGPLPAEENTTATIPPPVWLGQLDASRPVVFVSQGVIANFNQNQLLGPAIEALEHEDVEIIVTQGGRSSTLRSANPQVHMEDYLPYEMVFPKVDVFLTNGGFNGVQQALTYGVPIIVAGKTEEKPIVGHRVSRSGAGLDLGTSTPSRQQIHNAVFTVLGNRSFRNRAQELQSSFARYDSLHTIVTVAENLMADASTISKR